MNTYLPFVISGLVVGAIYAIAAMGLVLTYRTTGLFNFAHGAVSMGVAFGFFEMRDRWGVPSIISVPLALFVLSPLLGLIIDRLLFRSLTGASQASKVVVTVGLLILLAGIAEVRYGASSRAVASFLPEQRFKLASIYVSWSQVIIVAIAVAVLAGLGLFLRHVRLGLAMRAVVDNPDLVETAGFSSARVSSATWILGCMLAGLAGLLFTPIVGLDTTTLTLLVVQAFAPAVFGRLVSLPLTFAGALGLGVLSSVLLKLLEHNQIAVLGLRPSLPFILLFGLLVFARKGRLRELGVSAPWQGALRAGSSRAWLPVGLISIVVALTASRAAAFTLGLALVIACAFLSLTLLTGTSGLMSLCQAGLVGTGAFVYIHLAGQQHWPFLLAIVAAGVAVVPLGLIIALPALRLPGLFLALATFGFGLLLEGLLFTWVPFSGGQDGLRVARPALLHNDRTTVIFVVPFVVGAILLVGLVRRLALGRSLVAMRDSPVAAETLGVNLLWPRLAAFGLSAFMAGASGGLYALVQGSASKYYFSSFTSLIWVAVVVVGGVESPLGAVLGALLLQFAPFWLAPHPTLISWVTPAFGAGAILLARRPGGLVGWLGDRLPGQLITVRRVPSAAVT